MLRPRVAGLVVGVALGSALALAGCRGEGPTDPSESSTVEAFPDPPSVAGPLFVELRPALQLVNGDRRCRPDLEGGQLCSPDGQGGYRVLGTTRSVEVAGVTTAPSEDRTSWGTRVRFGADSRTDVRRARDEAVGFGGVVLATIGAEVVVVIEPPELRPARAAFLGLEKAEAWALVGAFANAQTRSKQGI